VLRKVYKEFFQVLLRGDSLKKLVFLLALILLSGSVFASLTLTRTTYGPDQIFEGYLSVNDTAYLDSIIEGKIRNCGSDDSEIMLYDLLVNSSLYSGPLYEYDKFGEGFSTLQKIFNPEDEVTYSFYINSQLSDFSFDMVSASSPIRIDVGANEEYNWQYFGEFNGWGNITYAEGYNGNGNYDTGYIENPHSGNVCSNFEINFEELQDEIIIKANAVAKKSSDDAGYLQAKIMGTNKICTFGDISTSWTSVSCNMTLDLVNEDSPLEIEVCLTSPTNLFLAPYDVNNDHYFMSINLAEYDNSINANDLSVPLLKSEINNYYSSVCGIGFCVIPFQIYGGSFGSLSFSPSLTYQGGGGTTQMFNVTQVVLDFNLTGKKLNLSFFDSLRTPDTEDEDCRLEIEFLNEDYEYYFNVSNAPVAIFEISSEYNAKNIPISFDGSSSEGEIVSWVWDFGDNTTASAKETTHTYTREGNFTIRLTVTGPEDIGHSVTKIIHIVSLEEVLEVELPDKIDELNSSIFLFNSLEDELKGFYGGMGFDNLVVSSYNSLVGLEGNFTSVRNSNSSTSSKDIKYKTFFDQFNELLEKTPKNLVKVDFAFYKNYRPNDPSDMPSFSKISLLNSEGLDKFRNRVYNFNQDVTSDYNYYIIDVDYFTKSENYVYVSKSFVSSGGELIEEVENYSNPIMFVSDCTFENSTGVVYCPSVPDKFEYSALADTIQLTSSLIIPLSAYEDLEDEVVYKFECESGDCEYSYCGDKMCFNDPDVGVNEGDKDDNYYCPKDCGGNIPWTGYISLGVILVLGILWINFYRGPGNFFDISNSFSYALFHKKLFLIEKDRVILKNYIIRALREGFSEGEIRKALLRKGWSKKQLDHVFSQKEKQKVI
jgi:PKD repeat protein